MKKSFQSAILKAIFWDTFNYFLINAYGIDRTQNLENNTAYNKSVILMFSTKRHFNLKKTFTDYVSSFKYT